MALRLIEIIVPKAKKKNIIDLKKLPLVIDAWQEENTVSNFIFKILVEAENSEVLIDKVSRLFKKDEIFRIVVQDVEATLPLVEVPLKEPIKKSIGKLTVSREELYNQVAGMAELNYLYLLMIAFATIIASFGFIEDKWVVIIGAMVVAPLIAPNIAFSLGVVLGDKNLGMMGILAMGAGVLLVLAISLILGLTYPPDIASKSLQSTLFFSYADIIVALASGAVAVLAFTSGTAFALIGVMVSISLLPPLVAAGLVLGMGNFYLFSSAITLFLINFVALNLSGVVTFWFQGVRPKNWWEEKKAKHYRLAATGMWLFLLIILIIIIYLTHINFLFT
ncbi:TIGR00341 family protein [Sulfurimonas autotrophica]|uniref:TIGR00341 family protein n=1 Tax=Sulfurimonas autotrophica (strain ATCC BAA-671 / DSM 16294 / JCM 11897 / OK10) TaxID=563040 RepID=E0UV05_SULAO|nr:TIGR00341 family protein [Sulfurimonas autotrophica]ADN08517.1 conserved hypothetical protein [Sulfurimonas autotrophica DSM 16294]